MGLSLAPLVTAGLDTEIAKIPLPLINSMIPLFINIMDGRPRWLKVCVNPSTGAVMIRFTVEKMSAVKDTLLGLIEDLSKSQLYKVATDLMSWDNPDLTVVVLNFKKKEQRKIRENYAPLFFY